MPWQRHVADVALELGDDGSYVYTEIDLTVPRQSGKTTLVEAKTLHRLIVMARTLGQPQRSTYTAQTRNAARRKLEEYFAVNLRRAKGFNECEFRAKPIAATDWKLSLRTGNEHLFFGNGSRWHIDAANRSASHGDTLDDATVDEAFAHQTDDVEGGIRPAQATRKSAQMWVLSTAGDGRSYYLWRKVKTGRQATEANNHGRVAFFEWSAPDDAEPGDPRTWIACSPALGYTIDLDFIQGEWERAQRKGTEGINGFRRAYLNQWPEIPILEEDGIDPIVPLESWARCLVADVGIVGVPSFAFDISEDRQWTTFAAAGKSSADFSKVAVEVIDARPGTHWALERANRLQSRFPKSRIAVAELSPAASLVPEMQAAGLNIDVVTVKDQVRDTGQFYDAVVNGVIHQRGQGVLDVSIRAAAKREIYDTWAISRKRSNADVTPLMATILAAGKHGLGAPLPDLASQIA